MVSPASTRPSWFTSTGVPARLTRVRPTALAVLVTVHRMKSPTAGETDTVEPPPVGLTESGAPLSVQDHVGV